MALPVKLQDVIEAMDITGEEHSQYLDRRTGEIFMVTNEEMEAAEEDELISEYPDWQREGILKARETLNSNDFVELPTQFDIDEYHIMEEFCLSFDDRQVSEQLLRQIKGSGAFRRFKHAIHSMGSRSYFNVEGGAFALASPDTTRLDKPVHERAGRSAIGRVMLDRWPSSQTSP
jgi:hypothetical protein